MIKLSNKIALSAKSNFYIAGFVIVNLYIVYSIYYMIYGQAIYPNLNTQLEFWSMMIWGILLDIIMELIQNLFGIDLYPLIPNSIFYIMIVLSIILLNVFAWHASKLAFKVYSAISKR
jgi:hypothetical protein